jgi:putative ABC transport system permease protein
MTTLLSDLAAATRALRRSPRFSALSILVLALGIGLNAMLFSVADAVVFRPFPFADADRLVIAGENLIAPRSEITYRAFTAWREQARTFDDMAAIGSSSWTWHLRTSGESMTVRYRVVSGHFFDLMGAGPLLGRTFRPDDDRVGSARTIVLSHGFWQRQFGGDAGVIGRTVVLSERSFTVVGVMPPAFRYPVGADVWTPLVPELAAIAASIPNLPPDGGDVGIFFTVGRLTAGATVDGARLELNRIIAQRAQQTGRRRGDVESRVRPVVDDLLGSARVGVLTLFAAVLLLLLVVCANVAGLALVRASGRSHEFAVRLALGASPAALARQLFSETLMLSVAATAAAIIAGRGLLPAIVSLLPADLPRIADAALDGRAVVFTSVIGLLTAFASSIAPAARVARTDLEPVLRRSSKAITDGGLRHPLRRALIAGEVAAAVVLLTAAGLLARSMVQLRHLDVGFNPSGLVGIEMSMPSEHMPDAERRALLARALHEVTQMPGVVAAGGVSLRPLRGPIGLDSPYDVEGDPAEAASRNPYVNTETITPSYFQAMQTRLVAGRLFDDGDRAGTTPVVIVSQQFAERAWRGQNALGRRLHVTALDPIDSPRRVLWTVVGIVGDIRYRSLESPGLTVYAPFAQSPDRINEFMVRTLGADAVLISSIRERLRAINGNSAIKIESMDDVLALLEAPWRANLTLFSMFAVLTALIACMGLNAMLAYAVVMQRREIGVRLVLGATPSRIAIGVVAIGARTVAAGAIIGAGAAAALTPLMRSILFEVTPLDPLILAAAPVMFAAVALAACTVPAVRAARTEPAVCLRAE